MPFPDDFVELDAAQKKDAIAPDTIRVSTITFHKGRLRLRLSFHADLIAVGRHMKVAYSARRKMLALELIESGGFKAAISGRRSSQTYITVPVPPGLFGLVKGMAGATKAWTKDGSLLTIPLPAELMGSKHEPPGETLPALPKRPTGTAALAEAARAAVPAPKFGAR